MEKEQLLYLLALSKVEGVGSILAKNLIAYCGSPRSVFTTSSRVLRKVPGVGPGTAGRIRQSKHFKEAERELQFTEREGIKITDYTHPEYPYRLKPLYDSPLLIFSKGPFDMNSKRTIAIIGTRKPTVYGKHLCRQLVEGLRGFEGQIISGLAYGVDAYAHQQAIKNKITTLGVLAHGLDRVYPAAHENLSQRMIRKGGGLLTEFLRGTKPDRENFPRRNRIVAGLADALVVVESPRKGGSMITAEYAWDYDRPIFVFPARTSDHNSIGCLELIKQHKASLIENAEDLLIAMNWQDQKEAKQLPIFELNSDEQLIMRVMQHEKIIHLEKLVEKSGLNAGKLAYLLLELEFRKLILSKPGKLYELT